MSTGSSSQKLTRFPESGSNEIVLTVLQYCSAKEAGVTGMILVNWLLCSLGRIICIKLIVDVDPKIN